MTRRKFADGEALVAEFFSSLGLATKRFDKIELRSRRTPDFQVFSEGHLVFYCEVKTAQKDPWLEDQLEQAPPLTLVGGTRPDPIYNRLSNYVHQASQQFDSVNPEVELPNVLAIVNEDEGAGLTDLVSVLTGYAFGERMTPVQMFRNYSEGRIREEKLRIHLYMWFGEGGPSPRNFWPEVHRGHHDRLIDLLRVEAASLKRLRDGL